MGCCRVYRSETRTCFLLTWALPQRNGNRASLLLVAVLSALLLPAAALAHVNVRPTLLVAGNETLLRIELPDLRPGRQPTGLDVSGPGVRQLSSEPSGLFGLESRFRVGVKVEAEPGPLPLLLLVRYADGQTVNRWLTTGMLAASASSTETAYLTWKVARSLGMVVFDNQARV